MRNRNSIALRLVPAATGSSLDCVSIGALQRWCAGQAAQVIFNCDGTVYAATAEDARHRQIDGDTFAFALGSDL